VTAERETRLLEHGFVRLDGAMASDLSVVNSARVSFAKRKDVMDESDAGLIRFLMRDRHGCYDDRTDVLTDEGWKPWPQVIGTERFATRSPGGTLEYQHALRLVRKEHRGHMIGFKGLSVDLLVTPDHRVLAEQTTTRGSRTRPSFSLRPAHSVLWRSHRHTARADWRAPSTPTIEFDGVRVESEPFLRLVGLFVGDGNLGSSHHLMFNVRKEREIDFLRRTAAEIGIPLKHWGKQGTRFGVPISSAMRRIFAACYEDGEKVIPRHLLDVGRRPLEALLDGLLASDGTRTIRGPGREDRLVYSTTSPRLADQVQELALKVGRSASVRPHPFERDDGHFGSKPRWRVTVYAKRNGMPGLCRTREQADNHMGVEWYDGTIHCVEVPNGTLYVRRGGYPVFSGNTPFEHNAFRFHIRCPLFVAREWFRHRVGSFNEESARYHQLEGDFYLPAVEDVRSQVGKPGAYTFEPVDPEVAEGLRTDLAEFYDRTYRLYQELIERGIAKELARSVLPMGTFTQFYWTINARSLMNFLSLRAAEAAQYEIRRYAEAIEPYFAELMPVTYEAFVAAGRVAP
jgi:thymidylate synthase (FAD)